MRDDSPDANPWRIGDPRTRTLLAAAVLVVIAWLVYRPSHPRSFHFADFGDFIPILESGTGIVDRAQALVGYYAEQGRSNILGFALLAAKWHLLGWWTPGWYIARAVLMTAVFFLAYILLRRLGMTRFGGLVGSSVFLWAPPAMDGWLYLTTAEPLGAAITLAMALQATRFQTSTHWKRDIAAFVAGTMALLLSKELLAPLVAIPLFLALTFRPDKGFALPERNKRNIALLLGFFLAATTAVVPIVHAAFTATNSAYASLYGREFQSAPVIFALWVSGLVPFETFVHPVHVPWILAFLGFTTLISAGWWLVRHESTFRSYGAWLLGLSLGIPCVGVLVYVPSPWHTRFYLLPYLIGAAILLGTGATFLEKSSRRGLIVVGLCWAGIGAFALGSAFSATRRFDATLRRDEMLVTYLGDSVLVDTIFFTTFRARRPEWREEAESKGVERGYAATLRRFASATGHEWPPVKELLCAQARELMAAPPGPSAIVDIEDRCALRGARTNLLTAPFKRLEWSALRVVIDSTHARIVVIDR